MKELDAITPDWPAPSRVRAVFTLRSGGVSQPPFNSLNLGRHVGDVPEAVDENRRRVRTALNLPAEPTWLEQVHGNKVLDLDQSPQTLRADGVVTRTQGVICAIQVADCMPVLFATRDGSTIGAAHAGWRGLASGVLEETVRTMAVNPSQLLAWMGPAIGQAHFEVGGEVREAFIAHSPNATSAFVPNNRGRWQCDLYKLAQLRLKAIGIRDIYGGGWCTYAATSRFFSYRRDGQCGRMAALIWLTGALGLTLPWLNDARVTLEAQNLLNQYQLNRIDGNGDTPYNARAPGRATHVRMHQSGWRRLRPKTTWKREPPMLRSRLPGCVRVVPRAAKQL